MRAHWVNPLEVQEEYVLKGESLHHLVNVIRIETGEALLLLNGEGLFVETIVESISKREMKLRKVSDYTKDRAFHFDLALGMPKREALELCLKEATELGFHTVFLIKSDYSQMRFPEEDRTEKLLISAVEQSNAPFIPKIIQAKWEDIPWTSYSESVLLDSQTKVETMPRAPRPLERKLLIVGPEGGFSPRELELLHSEESVKLVNLPTPILRTPTAVAAGAGIMIESLLK